MDITIQNIRHITVTTVLLTGLFGCSSTPAPWTQVSESPWEAKHEAESVNASQNAPELLADAEPEKGAAVMQDPEMEKPEMAPVPEVMVVVEDEPATQEIMLMLSSNYAVQVYAANTVASIEKYKEKKDLADLTTVKTERSGSIVYVLVDIHPNRTSANVAAAELEIKTGTKPWVRSLAGLQKIAVQ